MKDTVIRLEESELKQLIVDFVGNSLNSESEEITVESIIEVFSEHFPEFLMVVAEENWINGYTQALNDIQFVEEQKKKLTENERIHKK